MEASELVNSDSAVDSARAVCFAIISGLDESISIAVLLSSFCQPII